MGKTRLLAGAGALVVLAVGPSAVGQPHDGAAATAPAAPAHARQCMADLDALGQRMDDEGFWLSGYRTGFGWFSAAGFGDRGVAVPPGTQPNMGVRAPGIVSPPPVVGGAAAPQPGEQAAANPFASVDWQTTPTQALRTLYAAAHILAQNGDERGCQVVFGGARQLYEGYAHAMHEAGVAPGDIRTYRQQQLVLARPVAQSARGMRADAITGADLRNPRDERLGSVEDVVLDPGTGDIAYVIVARGGFLGLGRDHVAVPWDLLRTTPGLDTFVIDMARSQLDRAPKVDAGSFATDEGYARRRAEVDAFWSEHRAG